MISALWSTQRLSTFMLTQRISQHVDIIFNISTKEQWKNKMSITTQEAAMSYATTWNRIFPTSELSFTRGFMNELMTD